MQSGFSDVDTFVHMKLMKVGNKYDNTFYFITQLSYEKRESLERTNVILKLIHALVQTDHWLKGIYNGLDMATSGLQS
jgi:general stress protein 26